MTEQIFKIVTTVRAHDEVAIMKKAGWRVTHMSYVQGDKLAFIFEKKKRPNE